VHGGEAANINFAVFDLKRQRLDPQSTALEASTLIITPPM